MDHLAGREIEVTIRPIDEETDDKRKAFHAFLEKWQGILRDEDIDQLKWEYLKRKYELTDE